MTVLRFDHRWLTAGNDAPEYRNTMAELSIYVGDANLTLNEDIWSQTIRSSVLVSAYPLALWLASSWWRLLWEPLPAAGIRPSHDWRMAHELGAANRGFVWPQIAFVSDHQTIQVSAAASSGRAKQSARYVNGLEIPSPVPIAGFQASAEGFISAVVSRLEALDIKDTDLAQLWSLLIEERTNADTVRYRRLEAEMGFDPDECPEELMAQALAIEKQVGAYTLSELAPVYGKETAETPVLAIQGFAEAHGLVGKPTIPPMNRTDRRIAMPWLRAADDARDARRAIGLTQGPISNTVLSELLGLRASDTEDWIPTTRPKAAVGISERDGKIRFIPRKRHPVGKRFELARLLGDYRDSAGADYWLASTDLSTSRQKYQRAFAAEFLCPIAALQEFLQEDFTETATEDAAQHFDVSPTTVTSLLANNGLIASSANSSYFDSRVLHQQ